MKKLKNVFIFAFIFLVLIVSTHVDAIEDSIKNSFYEKNYRMVMVADKVKKYLMEQYNIKEEFEDKYPEYYGGIYINEDAENVIIQIVKENIPKENSNDFDIYNKIVSFDDSVKIVFVRNTFNELNEINNKISQYIVDEKDNNVIGCYIDVISNKVAIEIIDNSARNIKKIESSNDLKRTAVQFEKSQVSSLHAITMNAGGIFISHYLNNKYTFCSMGFRTKYNNQNGYVSAGHCFDDDLQPPSGIVTKKQYKHNENYDYGFVAINSNYSATNNLNYPSGNVTKLAVVNYCPTITTGMTVAKSGATTYYTSGKVKGLNQTVTYTNGVKIKGLVKTNVYNSEGDSGAPVFVPREDSQGGAILLGVLSGGAPGIAGIGTKMYFTSVNNMPSQFLTNRY